MKHAAEFPEYVKINTIWKRTERGEIVLGEYATPELEYLSQSMFTWTEKIDGTNIRVGWNGLDMRIGGRTDNSQISTKLYDVIIALVTPDTLRGQFGGVNVGLGSVVLYGEGYGAGVQKGGVYRPDPSFILFDVLVDEWWLNREAVFDVAAGLGLDVVSEQGTLAPLAVASLAVQQGQIASFFPNAPIEGLVGRPAVDLFDRKGNRIMAKIKAKDFKRVAESE